ncbi:hypothetical protein ACQ86N_26780 [Puia sp. P3]|uniref:hypothetical protein n=1 Tax=Puia sp. P3 TaxID=3423952 RepID=UPI003D668E1C
MTWGVEPIARETGCDGQGLDFSHADDQPDAVMNAMLWKFVKGEGDEAPAPRRAGFFRGSKGVAWDK